jgi:hypothetical protein
MLFSVSCVLHYSMRERLLLHCYLVSDAKYELDVCLGGYVSQLLVSPTLF